jgi:hypothetical protein
MNDDELRQHAFEAFGISEHDADFVSPASAPAIRFLYDGKRDVLLVYIDRKDDLLAQEHDQRSSVLALSPELLDRDSCASLSTCLNELWLRKVAAGEIT